jgi:hypothetical protein
LRNSGARKLTLRSSKNLAICSGVGAAISPASRGASHELGVALLDLSGGRRRAGGRGDFAAQRRDLLAQQKQALGPRQRASVKPLLRSTLEVGRIERAAGTAEIRVGLDVARERGVVDSEPELARLFVEGVLGQQLAENLPVQAERARLVGRDAAAELARERLQAVGIDAAEVLGADLGRADHGHVRRAEAAEHVGDAPDAEGKDQQAEENLGDPAAGALAQLGHQHGVFRLLLPAPGECGRNIGRWV